MISFKCDERNRSIFNLGRDMVEFVYLVHCVHCITIRLLWWRTEFISLSGA